MLADDERGETVLLDELEIVVRPRVFTASSPDVVMPIYWHAPIELVGYDFIGDELTLHWHSVAQMSERYVIFRHVIDPETGEIVAQVDSAPQNWRYPTSWWKAGEYVSDTVTLPLADLPAKSYEVRVGLYDEETGERVVIFGPDGLDVEDSVVPLFVFDR